MLGISIVVDVLWLLIVLYEKIGVLISWGHSLLACLQMPLREIRRGRIYGMI